MEAKLKIADFDCYNKSFSIVQRKEESRDAVVPDTQPDIAEVLYCAGKVLIRSKDVSAGRVRIEANIPASVLYRGEDSKIYTVELNVPVFMGAEDEKIKDESLATAQLTLLGLEARALNPRKVLVRAEMAAEICAFERDKLSVTDGVDDDGHIHSRIAEHEISPISAVTEKTFALTDEISLPPAVGERPQIIESGCECVVDEVKSVGTKLIIKGRVKSQLLLINEDNELCHLEPVTDFSQIIEAGTEMGAGSKLVWLTPSGAYCHISSESEGRLALEFHMVAQIVCRSDIKLHCLDAAYSNRYELVPQWSELKVERVSEPGVIRENLRQLFETARSLNEVLYASARIGRAVFEKGKMLLPVTFAALCAGGDGPWCEKRRTEIAFRLPAEDMDFSLKSAEILDCAVLPVPGGLELRLELAVEVCAREEESLRFIATLGYDEEKPIDNSEKPSLVLLRLKNEDELWDIARENCSNVEAILAANGIEDHADALGKLILIPKTS